MPKLRPANEPNTETLKFWRKQIEAAEKWSNTFRTRGHAIVERYRDQDRIIEGGRTANTTLAVRGTRYNILYSNTDTMLPVLFSEKPRAEVRATNIRDIGARHAAEMLEKLIEYSIDSNDFTYTMQRSVLDLLLPGLGVARVKLDTTFKQEDVEEETKDGTVTTEEDRIALQASGTEYVSWDDYVFPETVDWLDRPWEAFRGRMTFDEVVAMFNIEVAQQLEYTTDNDDKTKRRKEVNSGDTSDSFKKATIYEVWDKEKKQQLFISKTGTIRGPLEINDDPLELQNFFSTPGRPLLSVVTNNTALPVPLFLLYQDQARELDNITARITVLISELRRRGVYDAAIKEINKLSHAKDNQFVPIIDFARLNDKGGLNSVFVTEDVTPFANILLGLYNQRDQVLNIIFQIIGISDIQRAQTDPRETASAQRIKARYGTLRISRLQREVQRFIRDIIRLQAELIINTFTPEVIHTITGIPLESVIQDGKVVVWGVNDLLLRLKDQEPASVVVDIETDSTIAKDDLADKEKVVEFNGVMTQFAESAPLLKSVLGTDVTSEMALSLVRKFSMGRAVEQALLDQIENVKLQEQNPEPSQQQIDAKLKERELSLKEQELQIKGQIEFAKLQLEQNAQELEAAKLGLDNDIAQQKVDLKAISTVLEAQKVDIEGQNPNVNVVAGA